MNNVLFKKPIEIEKNLEILNLSQPKEKGII